MEEKKSLFNQLSKEHQELLLKDAKLYSATYVDIVKKLKTETNYYEIELYQWSSICTSLFGYFEMQHPAYVFTN